MTKSATYLYSPFCKKSVSKQPNPSLLLQFILTEMFLSFEGHSNHLLHSSPSAFFPYDWAYEVGSLNKIAEHAQLLPDAFPKHNRPFKAFEKKLNQLITSQKKQLSTDGLQEALRELYAILTPFINACKECESFLLFLMKHREKIELLTLNDRIRATR